MDFHCHLDLYPDARTVAREASRRNEFTWLVCTSPRAFAATRKVLDQIPNILITPGLHPEIAFERVGELDLLLQQMVDVSAVGEVGLDGSFRFRRTLDIQQRIFSAVVARSAELGGRVLSIHSRQAVKQVLSTLAQNSGYGTAVLHWFTGNLAELRTADDMGCWFSIGPAAFASPAGRALAAKLPKDRVVPESDGPFATVDGVVVQPWSSPITAQYLALAWSCSPEEASLHLDRNGRRLRAIMHMPERSS